MIGGSVTSHNEIVVPLRLRGPAGGIVSVDAVIDTGFTASLALPLSTVLTLGLARQSTGSATLADGSLHQFDVYRVEVEWDGVWRSVAAYSVGNDTLLGMHVLIDHELRAEVIHGGAVEIRPIP